jgi:CBS-domain-containing membrane protein
MSFFACDFAPKQRECGIRFAREKEIRKECRTNNALGGAFVLRIPPTDGRSTMTNSSRLETPRLALWADTAADLMTVNPVSIRDSASVEEAVALLTDKGFSAAPVIDQAGHPVGVVSRADILVHDREKSEYLAPVPEYFSNSDLTARSAAKGTAEKGDVTLVRDIMTPVVFSVAPETWAGKVVEEMVSLKVHRLFVVDQSGVLVGVISGLDVLRHLRPER